MGRAKDIIVRVIQSKTANAFIKKCHYSGKVVNNSSLHFGAFLDGRLHGVMSFGPSMRKDLVCGLVEGTGWNEFMELNRLAFDDHLPKNSESRCIAIAIKLFRRNAPHVKWILSYADGTQCGDGTIYRASGFKLTGIKKNMGIIRLASGEIGAVMTFSKGAHSLKQNGRAGRPVGSTFLEGFQLRYIYLIDKTCKITVPILPFSAIDEAGARMYKGKRPGSEAVITPDVQSGIGGSNPTSGLKEMAVAI